MNRSVVIASCFLLSMIGGVGFIVTYVFGADTQLEGTSLFLAFGALAAALVVWEHEVKPQHEQFEAMHAPASPREKQDDAADTFIAGYEAITKRRGWILTLFAGAAGVLGLAALVPLRSLTPGIGGQLAHTAWRAGLRLVRIDGTPMRVDDLAINSVETVFPEGFVGPEHTADMANAATMLVRVPSDQLALPSDRSSWAPGGCVAYSKVCTHAGCPLGLYRADQHELYCPCHQSTFDVLDGGTVLFGPAGRPLPQLPIAVRSDGFLIATGDFPEPIGPGYWDRA